MRLHAISGGSQVSDGERDVAGVFGDVAFEDVGAGTHDALEALAIQLHAAQGPLCHDGGRSRSVQQQGNLS